MLIKCPECELQASDKAVACPHCGYPFRPNTKTQKPRSKNNKRRRLPNGFGQISEIKHRNLRKPFRAMITVGKTPAGKPISKPLKPDAYFTTYNEAYAALVEYNKNPYSLDPGITVKQLYDMWSEEHFKTLASDSGIRAITSAWSYCSQLYDMRVIDLRARHIKGCMNEGVATVKGKEQRPSSYVQNKIKSMFNMMLDYALEYKLVDRNYSRSFSLSEEAKKELTTTKREHIPFSDEEMSLLWANVDIKRCVDVVLIQCYSGWRPQELGLIELENVDLKKWTFTGGMKTEAGTSRVVPIHPRIQPLVVRRYREAEALGSKYLFNAIASANNKPSRFTYNHYYRVFSKIRDELKLNPDHRPHDGRKHFVTAAKKNGVDEYAIKYVIGHRISDITERVYTKRDLEWFREEIGKIK